MPTEEQLAARSRTLRRALYLEEHFEGAGVYPSGSGQFRQFRRLVAEGLLAETGSGFDLDGSRHGEVTVFNLTETGRHLARHMRATAEEPDADHE